MAMKERSKQSRAGGGSAGLPADPTPALAGSTSRRYGLAERKALLEELASSMTPHSRSAIRSRASEG
jgi:hypothetical protein